MRSSNEAEQSTSKLLISLDSLQPLLSQFPAEKLDFLTIARGVGGATMLVDMVTNKQTSPTPLFPAGSNTVLARMERIFRRAASLVFLAGLLTTAGMVELARERWF